MKPDWADEIAKKTIYPHAYSEMRSEFVAALRKSKADGMRLVAEILSNAPRLAKLDGLAVGIFDEERVKILERMCFTITVAADKIERGET